MSSIIVSNSVGKCEVNLTKLSRSEKQHSIKEIGISISTEGEYDRAFTDGDNSQVVPTDTMKNTIYALAADHPIDSIESFGVSLTQHFLSSFDHISCVTVELVEDLWDRISISGSDHAHSFISRGGETRTALVHSSRENRRIEAGIEGLGVLKTTESSFTGFIRDRFTTLPERTDRICATRLQVGWLYREGANIDFNANYEVIRRTLLEIFANHDSKSVQHTIHAMGDAILTACGDVEHVSLALPNLHRDPFDLSQFDLENRNEVFVQLKEPYGLIQATMKRS